MSRLPGAAAVQRIRLHRARPRPVLVTGVAAIALLAQSFAFAAGALASRGGARVSDGPAAAGPGLSAPAGQPDFGPNVLVFDPGMPLSQIQAAVDGVASQQVGNQFGTPALRAAVRAGHLRVDQRPAQLPGRLLHRGRRPRPLARRRRHQRLHRRLQPVPRAQQLHRAQQLLAIAVEPHDQRQRTRPSAATPANFWAVSQAAPMRRVGVNGTDHADGLLHRAVVRERRLHRRLGRSPAPRSSTARQQQWLRAEQRPRRLDERRLEPGLLRRRGRAGRSASRPRQRAADRTPRSRRAR